MKLYRSASKPDLRQFLGVRCQYCDRPILFGQDHSDGKLQPSHSFVRLVLLCPAADCRRRADYSTATVSRFTKEHPAHSPGGEKRAARKTRK